MVIKIEAQLKLSTQQILERRPDLLSAVLPMLVERFPTLTREEIMVIAGIPAKDLRHTRVAQEWIEEGRQEGEAQGEALEQLEALAEALLDFAGPADLAAWLAEHNS